MSNFDRALKEMFDFKGVKPKEGTVESNTGTIWFQDEGTGKKFFLSIEECEP